MDDNPPRQEELIPRPPGTRGSRAGKAAQRKRKAYQAYIFQRDQDLGIYTDPSEVPFKRPDGSTRAVVRRPASAPFQVVEEQSEVIEIEEEEQVPETPPPSTVVGPFHRLLPSTPILTAQTEAPSSSSAPLSPSPSVPKSSTTPSTSLPSSSSTPKPSTTPATPSSPSVLVKAPPKARPRVAKEPSHPPSSSSVPDPKTPPKAPPRVPKEPSYPPPPPQVTEVPRIIDFRPLQTEVLDFEGVKVKLTVPAFAKFSFGLSLDFHGALDRYYKKSTSWEDPRPEFPLECVAALRDLHSLIPRYGGLYFVCSYCHAEDTKRHVIETTVNSCDTLFTQIGESPICLIFITRKATGPLGKRVVLDKLAREVDIPLIHVDDSAEVCDELAKSQHVTPLHIAIPKRSRGSRGLRTIHPTSPVPSFASFPECTAAIRGQVQKWFPDA